jgi:hypothetical protein
VLEGVKEGRTEELQPICFTNYNELPNFPIIKESLSIVHIYAFIPSAGFYTRFGT